MPLLHETPEQIPSYGQWVCPCPPCAIAVRASIPYRVTYVLKCDRGREVISARTLADAMDDGTLDAKCERAPGLGYIREIFVAQDGARAGDYR